METEERTSRTNRNNEIAFQSMADQSSVNSTVTGTTFIIIILYNKMMMTMMMTSTLTDE